MPSGSQTAACGFGPFDPKFDKGMRIAKDVMVEYAETFKALAKS